ncbi:MAG: hypothetical protein IPN29_20685 [Saprospiraceae bacterium]|nr:hypothetical protein [Saprospiraceae bacterium]
MSLTHISLYLIFLFTIHACNSKNSTAEQVILSSLEVIKKDRDCTLDLITDSIFTTYTGENPDENLIYITDQKKQISDFEILDIDAKSKDSIGHQIGSHNLSIQELDEKTERARNNRDKSYIVISNILHLGNDYILTVFWMSPPGRVVEGVSIIKKVKMGWS